MADADQPFERESEREPRVPIAPASSEVESAASARRVQDTTPHARLRANLPLGAVAALATMILVAMVAQPAFPGLTPAAASNDPEPSAPIRASAAAASPLQQAAPPSPEATVATAPVSLTERERSDQFWSAVSHFDRYGFTYRNLKDITEDSHLIVVGRIVGQSPGEIETFDGAFRRPVRFGVIEIDEVLKGTPLMLAPDRILVARTAVRDMPDSALPSGQVVLFLKNYAQLRVDEGAAASTDPHDRYYYARPNGYQCVLRDIDGLVRIVQGYRGWEDALGPFPSQLDGDPFQGVVARIRALAAE